MHKVDNLEKESQGKVTQQAEPIQFKENATYNWQESDVFGISGKEFEITHNTLAQIFEGKVPEPQMYIMLHQIYTITFNILKRNVENGIIKEVVQQPTEVQKD